jgi:2,4-dienoyl-CoA reductase-like NADH-dependent reductase (Old Yellow Enzyme family)
MNSVDATSSASVSDTIEQIKLIAECGIDFIEISGGTYENPQMMADGPPETNPPPKTPSSAATQKTSQRESFFLEFAKIVRETFPDLVLMVTGGFRTRVGMEKALKSGGCDLIGIGRPAAVVPRLPKEIILNIKEVPDEQANVALAPIQLPLLVQKLRLKQVGAGIQTTYYGGQIGRMARGLAPVDTRIQVSA